MSPDMTHRSDKKAKLDLLSDVTHRSNKREAFNLELTTLRKLRGVLNKEQRDKLIKREKQFDLFLVCDYIFILV